MHDEIVGSVKNKEAMYSWFASFYLHAPSPKLLQPLLDPVVLSLFTRVFHEEECRKTLSELIEYVERNRCRDFISEFNILFLVPARKGYVPPYESCFREKKGDDLGNLWGETTAEVARFYRDVGYEVKNLQGIFAPDHIGVELAFIAKLCADELHFLENDNLDKSKEIENLRKSFLKEHICYWIEDFSKAVGASSCSSFYKYLNALTMRLICLDLRS